MSQPYEYTDVDGDTLRVTNYGPRGYVRVSAAYRDMPGGRGRDVINVDLTPSERARAAAALAGDGYQVVPVDEHERLIEQAAGEFGPLDMARARSEGRAEASDPKQRPQPERIDPKDVKVGMVVEVAADDGTWSCRAPVVAVNVEPVHHAFAVSIDGMKFVPHPPSITVHVVRPAPDPAEDEIHAIATVLHESGTAGFDARDLHARGVRVVDDGGQ